MQVSSHSSGQTVHSHLKPKFGSDAADAAIVRLADHFAPIRTGRTGVLSTVSSAVGKFSTFMLPYSNLLQAGQGFVQTFFGHHLAVKRMERENKMKEKLLSSDNENQLKRNYQKAALASGVLLSTIFVGARAASWFTRKRLEQKLEGTYEWIGDEVKNSHFKNLIGHEELKKVLQGEILSRVKHPELFPPGSDSSAILYGPPGTGKTESIKCLANEALQLGMPVHVLNLNAAKLVSEPGVASRILDKLHRDLEKLDGQKAFLILDEADSLGSRDKVGAGTEASKAINTLLQKIDGINGFKNVSLFAMTNRLEDLDEAFLNRIRHKIPVGKPNGKELGQMFKNNLTKVHELEHGDSLELILPQNLNMYKIVQAAEGFSGRSVKNAINNLIDRVVLENIDALKQQQEEALKSFTPPKQGFLQGMFSSPPEPPKITYKIPFTEAQLLKAIKHVHAEPADKKELLNLANERISIQTQVNSKNKQTVSARGHQFTQEEILDAVQQIHANLTKQGLIPSGNTAPVTMRTGTPFHLLGRNGAQQVIETY